MLLGNGRLSLNTLDTDDTLCSQFGLEDSIFSLSERQMKQDDTRADHNL